MVGNSKYDMLLMIWIDLYKQQRVEKLKCSSGLLRLNISSFRSYHKKISQTDQ